MGGTWRRHGQCFDRKTWRDLGVGGRIMLRRVLKKCGVGRLYLSLALDMPCGRLLGTL